jgi:hypothetical protein
MLISRLSGLLAKATKGKWRRIALGGSSTILIETKPARNNTRIPAYGHCDADDAEHCIAYPFIDDQGPRLDFVCFSHEDAELITETITALPLLLANITYQRAQNAEKDITIRAMQKTINRLHREAEEAREHIVDIMADSFGEKRRADALQCWMDGTE